MYRVCLPLLVSIVFLCSCSVTHTLQKKANRQLIAQQDLKHAYVGICLYDPITKRFLYQHDAHRYFTPASNTKLFSFYMGLSFIGDSTTGIQYQIQNDTLYIRGTGDPSLLHPDFPVQPAFNFLKTANLPIVLTSTVYENKPFGPGWAWDDYSEDYQPERSAMPIYGNVAWFSERNNKLQVTPSWFAENDCIKADTALYTHSFYVHRAQDKNIFHYNLQAPTQRIQQVPFIVDQEKTTVQLLQETLHKPVFYRSEINLPTEAWETIPNVPLDSLFKHMMYRSDNFYAEQTDQMSSMKLFDTISTHRMIRYMLQHKLDDLPDPPRWVDGSGLSRFNLFSPADLVFVLNRLYQEFPHQRIYAMLPTGGKGTLSSLYHDMAGSIYAKTGSLSNNVALSGYLITQKGRTLIFSMMINHCVCPLQEARIAMEHFLREVWKKY